jgi:pyridoxine 4-dehydrogenase
MKAALNCGCNFWNGGEFYGTEEYNSLHLLQRYFTKYPEDASKVVLSIKGGLNNMRPDGSPENVQRSVEECLRLLKGTKCIDIFEMARVDKNVSLEVTLKELEKYVQVGKIGGIALSEVSAATIRKAAGITKIVAVEVELSLWTTDVFNNGVAAACAEHSIPLVA